MKEVDKKKVLENKIRLAAVQIIKDSFGLLGAEAYNPLVVGIKTLIKEKKIDSAKGAAEMMWQFVMNYNFHQDELNKNLFCIESYDLGGLTYVVDKGTGKIFVGGKELLNV